MKLGISPKKISAASPQESPTKSFDFPGRSVFFLKKKLPGQNFCNGHASTQFQNDGFSFKKLEKYTTTMK